jgi:hypothetical protein
MVIMTGNNLPDMRYPSNKNAALQNQCQKQMLFIQKKIQFSNISTRNKSSPAIFRQEKKYDTPISIKEINTVLQYPDKEKILDFDIL